LNDCQTNALHIWQVWTNTVPQKDCQMSCYENRTKSSCTTVYKLGHYLSYINGKVLVDPSIACVSFTVTFCRI